MNMTVQARKQEEVLLPTTLQKKYGIQEGDNFQLLDLDGLFMLAPFAPVVSELACEIYIFFAEQRERYYHENWDGSF